MWRMDLSLETTITSLDSGLFYLLIRLTDWDASTADWNRENKKCKFFCSSFGLFFWAWRLLLEVAEQSCTRELKRFEVIFLSALRSSICL